MSETLTKLETVLGERSVATIETKELREWLLALPLAAKTRNKHRGYARISIPKQVIWMATTCEGKSRAVPRVIRRGVS